jgi:hypothetical protein
MPLTHFSVTVFAISALAIANGQLGPGAPCTVGLGSGVWTQVPGGPPGAMMCAQGFNAQPAPAPYVSETPGGQALEDQVTSYSVEFRRQFLVNRLNDYMRAFDSMSKSPTTSPKNIEAVAQTIAEIWQRSRHTRAQS